jgi:hypothetical protein
MNKKWSYFTGAAILAAYILLSHGAPLLAVVAGIAGSALFVRRASRVA